MPELLGSGWGFVVRTVADLEQALQASLANRDAFSIIEVDLDKEKEINAIQKDLKAGKDFAQLAMAHSKHVSGKRGGDIGFVTQKQYKVLTDVAFTMKPGEISKPFKTPTGWAIIKVTEFVKKQAIPLEEDLPITSHGVPYTAATSPEPREDIWRPCPKAKATWAC